MAELKTKQTDDSVDAFIAAIEDPGQQADAKQLCKLMKDVTGQPGKMWGTAIIGFDTYHYTYKSGREGDWMVMGFSPRKGKTTLYIMDLYDNYNAELAKIGKHKIGKGCLYINRLSDINLDVLTSILKKSVPNIKSGKFLLGN